MPFLASKRGLLFSNPIVEYFYTKVICFILGETKVDLRYEKISLPLFTPLELLRIIKVSNELCRQRAVLRQPGSGYFSCNHQHLR